MSALDAASGALIRTALVHGAPVAVGIDEARGRAIVAAVIAGRGRPVALPLATIVRLFYP